MVTREPKRGLPPVNAVGLRGAGSSLPWGGGCGPAPGPLWREAGHPFCFCFGKECNKNWSVLCTAGKATGHPPPWHWCYNKNKCCRIPFLKSWRIINFWQNKAKCKWKENQVYFVYGEISIRVVSVILPWCLSYLCSDFLHSHVLCNCRNFLLYIFAVSPRHEE